MIDSTFYDNGPMLNNACKHGKTEIALVKGHWYRTNEKYVAFHSFNRKTESGP